MAYDLSRGEIKEEENLLIEAVSLLVQRQREAESWIAEQVWQAEERVAASERRYAELEARLTGIEDQLNRLARDIEPGRSDSAANSERLARLREQVEGLKSAGDGRPVAPAPPPIETTSPLRPPRSAEPAPAAPATPVHEPDVTAPLPAAPPFEHSARPVAAPPRAAAAAAGPGFLELLGNTPQDRWGLGLIGLGAVAVLYAVLTQLRF